MIYQVWREGYRLQEAHETAKKIGEINATSFQEACDLLLSEDPQYDRDRLSVWGCKLFTNEADARKFLG